MTVLKRTERRGSASAAGRSATDGFGGRDQASLA